MMNISKGTRGESGCVFVCGALISIASWVDTASALEAADGVTANPQTTQTTFFSDETVDFVLELTAEDAVDGTVSWQFSTLHRTLGRGDTEIEIEPAKPGSVSFRLRMPHVKEGVVGQAVLKASFQTNDGAAPALVYERELSIFPRDPFADRAHWLEELELQLFDPEGRTAKLFDDARIPFREVRSATRLRSSESGMIVVGEGIELRNHAGLADALMELAGDGRHLIWFAPAEGEIQFPGSDGFAGKSPKNLSFLGSNMIEQLDKRLDSGFWSERDTSRSVGLGILARRNRCYIEVVEPSKGWTWMHAQFSDPEGHLILCGLRIVDDWEKSPTPRFMLARLLEHMDNLKQLTEPTDE